MMNQRRRRELAIEGEAGLLGDIDEDDHGEPEGEYNRDVRPQQDPVHHQATLQHAITRLLRRSSNNACLK